VKAVNLSRKLVLEQVTRTADSMGGHVLTWVPLGTLWADVQPGTGGERYAEFVTLSNVAYRITVRGAPQGAPSRPKPEQRFRDGIRIFHIVAVTEADIEAQYLTCFAQEEVGA